MAVKKYKPVTPSMRGRTGYTFEEITKDKPERSLVKTLRKKGGRNSYGRITVRHRGGGHKRKLAWLISSGRNSISRPRLLQLNMIPTAQPGWPCCTMLMVKNAISLPL